MRRNIRTKMMAACMVSIAMLTLAGCKGAEPTKEFSQPVMSSSISAAISADGPKVINNQGKFSYKLDESAYSSLLKTATPTQYTTGTGHAVYLDADGKQFIISGYEQVYLTDGVIPTEAHATLRTEKEGIQFLVQADKQAVEQYETARGQAADLLSSPDKADELTIIVNQVIMSGGADTASIEDNVAYVFADTLLSAVDNIRLVQVEGDNLDFTITNPNTGDKLQYTINESNPSTIVSSDLSESLSADFPLVIFVDGRAFIDVESMATVFDWQVKRMDNVVSIVTDSTIANGKAITIEDCRIPAEDKTEEKLDELQQGLDEAQEAASKAQQEQQTAPSQVGQSQASNGGSSNKPQTPTKPTAPSGGSSSVASSGGSSSMSQSDRDKIEDVWGELGETGHGDNEHWR